MINAHESFLLRLLSFGQRRLIEKNADAPAKLREIRKELKVLTKRARELPVSDELVLRKYELVVPDALANELAELRAVLQSRNLRVI